MPRPGPIIIPIIIIIIICHFFHHIFPYYTILFPYLFIFTPSYLFIYLLFYLLFITYYLNLIAESGRCCSPVQSRPYHPYSIVFTQPLSGPVAPSAPCLGPAHALGPLCPPAQPALHHWFSPVLAARNENSPCSWGSPCTFNSTPLCSHIVNLCNCMNKYFLFLFLLHLWKKNFSKIFSIGKL